MAESSVRDWSRTQETRNRIVAGNMYVEMATKRAEELRETVKNPKRSKYAKEVALRELRSLERELDLEPYQVNGNRIDVV